VTAWRSAKVVHINDGDTYAVKFTESGTIWMECPKGKVRRDMRLPTAVEEIVDKSGDDTSKQKPDTWQYHSLVFQESIPATFVVCIIVFLELFLVTGMEDEESRLAWSLAVSAFFLSELTLRMYVYLHTYGNFSGFFTDPFRVIDFALVVVDLTLLILIFTLGGLEDARAIKLVRVARLARNAKGLRAIKGLRTLKFCKALWTTKWPTSPEKTLEMLDSVPWTAFVVVMVVVQFLLVNSEDVDIEERILTLMNVILAAFFLVEVSTRLGLYCMLRDNSLAFCRDDFGANFIDMGVVFLDVAVIAMSLLASSTVASESTAIKMFRLVRMTRCVSVVQLVRLVRGVRLFPKKAPLEAELPRAHFKDFVGTEAPGSDLVTYTGFRGVKYADGCIYQGNWKNGFEEGSGHLSFPNGDSYKGSFKMGLKQGRGLFLFQNGDEFKGSFSKNLKHGPGVYLWADGDRFEATYEKGREHGKATFFSTDGRVVEYHFKNGVEVPAPEDEKKSRAAATFKGFSFKEILAPGSNSEARL